MVSCCGVDWGCVPQLWNRVVLRKWLNIGNGLGDSDFSADECGPSDGDTDREGHLPPSSSNLSPPCVIGRKLF
jgi:type I inositol polyphosphate 5-phosphatase IP5P1/2